MMRDYFKILSSMIVALLTFALVVAMIASIYTLATGGRDISDDLFLPFLLALIGFILFGIPGSIFWLVFFRALSGSLGSVMKRHLIAASMAVVSSVTLSVALFFRGGLSELGEVAVFLVPVILVAAFSLLWYWLLFEKLVEYRQKNAIKNRQP